MPDAPGMSQTPVYTRRQIVHGYLVLPHAVPILAVLAATAAFAFVAERGWPGLVDFICLIGAMFGAQLAIGAVNELVDADLDATAKPDKPIPAGLVSRRGARGVLLTGLLLMGLFSLRFSLDAFLLCALGAGIGIAYSLWFKRTIWGWVPYLIALPLIPIWVWSALSEVDPALLAIYPIGALAVISIQIAQSLPDLDADLRSGVRTLAVALGPNRAHLACWSAMGLATTIAAISAYWLTDHPARVWIAAAIAITLVIANVIIWRVNPRSGTMAAFACMALAASVLGIGWTLGIIGT
jgi:geranylgeranylglycerol-phosphate geranylgeranyltransferase